MPSNYILNEYDNNSDSSDFTNASFRVSVCLKRYFSDVRALCFILITRKRTVKWLERKIQNIFHLQDRFCLTTNGHFLPSSERLGLLNPDDIVEVIPNELASKIKYHGNPCFSSYNNSALEKDILDTGHNHDHEPCPDLTLNYLKNKDKFLNTRPQKCQDEHRVEENFINDNNVLNDSLQTDQEKDDLQQVKQSALALLDSTYGISSAEVTEPGEETGVIPRKRKRVRRKRQLVESLPMNQDMSIKSSASLTKSLYNVEESLNTCSIGYERDTCISTESSLTNSNLVVHNEIATVRKPRIVKSIINTS